MKSIPKNKSGFILISSLIAIMLGTLVLSTALLSLNNYVKITRLNVNKTRAYYTAVAGANVAISTIKTTLSASQTVPEYVTGVGYVATITIYSQVNLTTVYHIISTGTVNETKSNVESFYSTTLPPTSTTLEPPVINPDPTPSNPGQFIVPAHCVDDHGSDAEHNKNCNGGNHG